MVEGQSVHPSSPLAHLEGITKIAGLVSTAALCISVAYDGSYLFALGLTFGDVPTLLSDHLRSALVWAPFFALLLAIVWTMEIFWPKEPAAGSAKTKSPRRMLRDIALLEIALVVVTYLFVSGTLWIWFAVLGALPIIMITSSKTLKSVRARAIALACYVFAALLAFAAVLGATVAELSLKQNKPQWLVTMKSGEIWKTTAAKGLRRFSAVSILVDEKNRVMIVANEMITDTVREEREQVRRPGVCEWLHIMCPERI